MESKRNTVRKPSNKIKNKLQLNKKSQSRRSLYNKGKKNNRCILKYVIIPIVTLSIIISISVKFNHNIKADNVQVATYANNSGEEKNLITYFNNGVYSTAEWLSVRCQLNYMAQKDFRIRSILDCYKEYPIELLKLLCNNPETTDFVYHYLYLQNNDFSSSITDEEFTRNIPDLKQWDKRWGYASYGSSNIAISGCAPTSLAMVVAGLTGNKSITPYYMAKYSEEKGYYIKGIGTSWNLMTEGCKEFGVESKELQNKKDVMIKELESGRPIICSMLPGQFTAEGHFIVISGYKDGKFIINDPNSIKRSTKQWSYEEFYNEINSLWSFKVVK